MVHAKIEVLLTELFLFNQLKFFKFFLRHETMVHAKMKLL